MQAALAPSTPVTKSPLTVTPQVTSLRPDTFRGPGLLRCAIGTHGKENAH